MSRPRTSATWPGRYCVTAWPPASGRRATGSVLTTLSKSCSRTSANRWRDKRSQQQGEICCGSTEYTKNTKRKDSEGVERGLAEVHSCFSSPLIRVIGVIRGSPLPLLSFFVFFVYFVVTLFWGPIP